MSWERRYWRTGRNCNSRTAGKARARSTMHWLGEARRSTRQTNWRTCSCKIHSISQRSGSLQPSRDPVANAPSPQDMKILRRSPGPNERILPQFLSYTSNRHHNLACWTRCRIWGTLRRLSGSCRKCRRRLPQGSPSPSQTLGIVS